MTDVNPQGCKIHLQCCRHRFLELWIDFLGLGVEKEQLGILGVVTSPGDIQSR